MDYHVFGTEHTEDYGWIGVNCVSSSAGARGGRNPGGGIGGAETGAPNAEVRLFPCLTDMLI